LTLKFSQLTFDRLKMRGALQVASDSLFSLKIPTNSFQLAKGRQQFFQLAKGGRQFHFQLAKIKTVKLEN